MECHETATVTVAVNTIYKMKFLLPHTDSAGIKTIYGVKYTPFSSIAYTCSNIFSTINSPYSNAAVI